MNVEENLASRPLVFGQQSALGHYGCYSCLCRLAGDTYPQTRIAAGVDGLDTAGEDGPVARSLLKLSDANPLLASVNGLGDH